MSEKFYVSSSDKKQFLSSVRLKDHLTFNVDEMKFTSKEHSDKKAAIINWLPADERQVVDVKVMMPDGTYAEGLAEKNIERLEIDDIIQFERFGFCRLDSKEPYEFWYAHE